MKQFTCTVCPKGCRVSIDEKNGFAISGNACPRGAQYAKKELSSPTRVVTSTVRIKNALVSRCPVKTDRDIPREKIFEAVALLDGVELKAPVHIGDIVIADLFNSGASFVVTKEIGTIAEAS